MLPMFHQSPLVGSTDETIGSLLLHPIVAEPELLLIYKEFTNIFLLSPRHQLDHQLDSW